MFAHALHRADGAEIRHKKEAKKRFPQEQLKRSDLNEIYKFVKSAEKYDTAMLERFVENRLAAANSIPYPIIISDQSFGGTKKESSSSAAGAGIPRIITIEKGGQNPSPKQLQRFVAKSA